MLTSKFLKNLTRFCCALGMLVGGTAKAEIIRLPLKNKQTAAKFGKGVVEIEGMYFIVGEPKSGMRASGDWAGMVQEKIELWVVDFTDPTRTNSVAKIAKTDLLDLEHDSYAKKSGTFRFNKAAKSLKELADEYQRRLSLITDERSKLSKYKRSSREWFNQMGRVLTSKEELYFWLIAGNYKTFAARLNYEITSDRKQLNAISDERGQSAQTKIVQVNPLPYELLKTTSQVMGPYAEFGIQESAHVRIVYFKGDKYSPKLHSLNDAKVTELLKLAESAIEGFRQVNVNPYIGGDFEEYIPEEIFQEYFFAPGGPDGRNFELFLTQYYGHSWGSQKNERVRMHGSSHNLGSSAHVERYLTMWKLEGYQTQEDEVLHILGHTLANLHYNNNRNEETPQPWIDEALAYQIPFSYLGRNAVTCSAFGNLDYGKATGGSNTTDAMGYRARATALALEKGPSLSKLTIKPLLAMEPQDIAKSWSFYDFVVKELSKPGQLLLRAAMLPKNRLSKEEFDRRRIRLKKNNEKIIVESVSMDPNKWREDAQILLTEVVPPSEGVDVFAELDKLWKTFVTKPAK